MSYTINAAMSGAEPALSAERPLDGTVMPITTKETK